MAKKYYAVIDTNVVVSSTLKHDSLPGYIIDLCLNKTIVPILNSEIVDEYREVLTRNKFDLSDETINETISELENLAIFLDKTTTMEDIIDEDDVVFYEIALTARNKLDNGYLVTGNKKHFPIKSFVVTPREMLEIIEKDNEN